MVKAAPNRRQDYIKPERIIVLQKVHKSLPVLRDNIRRGSRFTENAAAMIGL